MSGIERRDDRMVITSADGWTDRYLFIDKENAEKLVKLTGGKIQEEADRLFPDDDSFDAIRNYCDQKDIEYQYTSWTSGDDLDDMF